MIKIEILIYAIVYKLPHTERALLVVFIKILVFNFWMYVMLGFICETFLCILQTTTYSGIEIPIFILMGVIGELQLTKGRNFI